MKTLILGSASPRRAEILGHFSLPFMQVASAYDESKVIYRDNPSEYVVNLSLGKSTILFQLYPEHPILTADTIVVAQNKIYGKPRDEEEAFQYLTELAGKWHSVFTGLSLRYGDKLFQEVEETRVLFNPLTANQIRHYHTKLHWSDKAGGYGIQLGGGLIVKRIEGCYYNILGLPINALRTLLHLIDIDLWDYLK